MKKLVKKLHKNSKNKLKRNLLLSTATMLFLIGCDSEMDRNEPVRVRYPSREACLKDWNTNPNDCNQVDHVRGFYGPWFPYYMYMGGFNSGRYSSGEGVMTQSTGSFVPRSSFYSSGGRTAITRGGFGSIGHGFSAGE